MTTICVKVIHNERTGCDEVFRTAKPEYVPKGYTLVKNLQSFTIGVPLPYSQPDLKKRSHSGRSCLDEANNDPPAPPRDHYRLS